MQFSKAEKSRFSRVELFEYEAIQTNTYRIKYSARSLALFTFLQTHLLPDKYRRREGGGG